MVGFKQCDVSPCIVTHQLTKRGPKDVFKRVMVGYCEATNFLQTIRHRFRVEAHHLYWPRPLVLVLAVWVLLAAVVVGFGIQNDQGVF